MPQRNAVPSPLRGESRTGGVTSDVSRPMRNEHSGTPSVHDSSVDSSLDGNILLGHTSSLSVAWNSHRLSSWMADRCVAGRRGCTSIASVAQEGYRVLRFWNHEVLMNLEGVLHRIAESAGAPLTQPSPQGGRGRNSPRRPFSPREKAGPGASPEKPCSRLPNHARDKPRLMVRPDACEF